MYSQKRNCAGGLIPNFYIHISVREKQRSKAGEGALPAHAWLRNIEIFVFLILLRTAKKIRFLYFQKRNCAGGLMPNFYIHISVSDYIFPRTVQPQSTYIYRLQSSVWLLPKSDLPTPSSPSHCVLPPHQRPGGGGGYTHAGRRGGGGSIVRKTPDIGLASYSIIPL
jgi:hypothetical protein